MLLLYNNNTGILSTIKESGVKVFDTYQFTKDIAKLNSKFHNKICWDRFHYYPFVYREVSKKLIDFLLF